MIVYLADRKMQILGQASSHLPEGLVLYDDKKTEDVETGVTSFEFTLLFGKENRLRVEEMAAVGNYILRQHNNVAEFYTIIDSEINDHKKTIDIYAEDAGLDLLNNVAHKFESKEAHNIAWYVNKWISGSGFEIGINEIPDLTRTLKWDGETTVTKRLDSIATEFDNAELSYSFKVDKLRITNKYINIYKKRGASTSEELRIDKNLNNIKVKSSIANLATALYVTGGTPEGKDEPITLSGYKYDDGDFYVDGKYLKSRKAVQKWSRFLSESGTGEGHIEKTYTFDTTSQSELCNRAVSELKKVCVPEVNYEVDIAILPDNIKIGDTINIVNSDANLYLSARVLKLESSITDNEYKATLGNYLIKDDGINADVRALAAQFAQLAKNRVFYTWVVYADDENGNGISLDPTGKSYMGISTNRSKIDPDLTDPTAYKWSKIEGEDGRSLVDIVEHYLISSDSTGVTIETPGWSLSILTMTSTQRYLWNYETFVYSNGDEEDSTPKIIGVYGDKGDKGDDSPTITKMTREYVLSSSNTEVVTTEPWSPNLPEWQAGKYLWSRWATWWSTANPTPITYSDPVLDKTWNEIHETATDAKTNADAAKTAADAATSKVNEINGELEQTNKELDAISSNLATITSELHTDYAKKTELTNVESSLNTKIEQNAASITSTANRVTTVETNASDALNNAAIAQAAADAAKQNAIDAQNKYTQLQSQADATDAELNAAKQAVEKAQADATAAGDAAAAAQSAADGLASRVTETETKIVQNSESILSIATKVNSMKIGGRNYLSDSHDEQDSTNTKIASYELDDNWISGQTYTLSFNGTKTGGNFAAYCDDGTTILSDNIAYNESSGKYECTFVCPDPPVLEEDAKPIMTIYLLPKTGDYSGSVKLVKLEKGNIVTDWSPASSDANDYTDLVTDTMRTEIRQTTDEIISTALGEYVKSSELGGEVSSIVSSQITQNNTSIELQFTNVTTRLDGLDKIVETQNEFIRMEGANVVIGKQGDPIQARFTNNALEFSYSNQTVAKFTNEVLEVKNITVENQVRFGDKWAIRPGANIPNKGNNLDDVWIGG